ncbi:MAG: hypothetical protein ACNYWU_07225 [Desulfobacterales bacterium]
MEKFWKFFNSAFISALISGLLLLLVDNLIEKRDSENNKQDLSQIEKLSDSIESLLKFKAYAEKYIIENKHPITQKTKEWKRLLDVSWGKKNDKYLVKTYASFMNDKVPFYVKVVSVESDKAEISILREDLSVPKIKSEVLTKKGHYTFEYNDYMFRLNLIDIRAAGLFRTIAAYFTIDVLLINDSNKSNSADAKSRAAD